MMGHNIGLCEAMFVAWDTLFSTGSIDHRLNMELGAFIALHYGMQVFMRTLTRAQRHAAVRPAHWLT